MPGAGCPFVVVEIKVCGGVVEASQPPALTLVWDSPRQRSALGCASWCEPAPALGKPLPGAVIAEATASKPAEVTGTREEGSWDKGKTQSAGTDSPGISPAGIPPHPGLNACAVLLKETHLSLAILQP